MSLDDLCKSRPGGDEAEGLGCWVMKCLLALDMGLETQEGDLL